MEKLLITGPSRSGTTLMNYLMEYFEGACINTREQKATDWQEEEKRFRLKSCDGMLIGFDMMVYKWPPHANSPEEIQSILDMGFWIIFMQRDGRDCMVSKLDGVYFCHPQDWVCSTETMLMFKDHPKVHIVKYEDLVTDPYETLYQTAVFLDRKFFDSCYASFHATISPEQQKLIGNPRPVDANSIGNWKKEEHEERMVQILTNGCYDWSRPNVDASIERICDLLIKTGYEADNKWVDAKWRSLA